MCVLLQTINIETVNREIERSIVLFFDRKHIGFAVNQHHTVRRLISKADSCILHAYLPIPVASAIRCISTKRRIVGM